MAYNTVLFLLLVWSAVVLLLSGVSSSQEDCKHNIEHTEANCSGRHLDRVPWGLHFNIQKLDLSNNRFTELSSQSFKKYKNLRVLSLRNNSLRMLDADALAGLVRLHTLDLSRNQLTYVPTDMLAKVPNVLTLNLANNNMMLVSDYAFQGLSMLKTLDLSGNRIGEVEPYALAGLPELQKLYLHHNSLRWLPNETFALMSPNLMDLHLDHNPWICDCHIRWMHLWMNGTFDIWRHPGRPVLCNGPSISQGKWVSTIPLDELACMVEMRKSASTQFVDQGKEAVLECIYFSIPFAKPLWQKRETEINFKSRPDKYSQSVEGSVVTTAKLYIKDFQRDDIANYKCVAQNVRGFAEADFKVTLTGVPFESVPQPSLDKSSSAGVDTKTIVVVVAAVCGIILFVVFTVLIICCVTHIRRRKQEKRDAVVENVKKHFMANGEPVPADQNDMDKSSKEQDEIEKSKLDQFNDDTNSESTRTNDTNTTHPKHSIESEYPHMKEPMYTYQQQPNSPPLNNGNTYISFGSEMTEPESLQMYPTANSTMRYDGSQTESTTPLLDRYTPSVFDSDDPLDDSLHYPMYEAATLYYPKRNHFPEVNGMVPPLTPGSTRSNTRSTTFIPAYAGHYADYSDYQELRYPYNLSPEHHMLASKKSMSVGNLGYQPAPRKPPRVFHHHSGEYVETSPHDTSGSASDYMSVPSQAYHYGMKPGTPV